MELVKNSDFSFWKNIFLVAIFFTIAPITLGVSLFSLYSLGKITPETHVVTKSGARIYASLPSTLPLVGAQIGTADARVEIVRQYLNNYNSPLESLANVLVQTADKYDLDFRLTTAIAQQESNLCKLIPPSSFNCWGWGIHSQGTLGFNSFEEGIEEVSRGLKQEYIDKGYQTPEEIMSKYTPLSNGSWARGVNQFMADMQ